MKGGHLRLLNSVHVMGATPISTANVLSYWLHSLPPRPANWDGVSSPRLTRRLPTEGTRLLRGLIVSMSLFK